MRGLAVLYVQTDTSDKEWFNHRGSATAGAGGCAGGGAGGGDDNDDLGVGKMDDLGGDIAADGYSFS